MSARYTICWLKAGANRVIAPEVVGGQRMAALVLRPETPRVVESLTTGQSDRSWIDELVIDDGSPLCGQTLEQARLQSASGATIIAVRHASGRIVTNPTEHEVLQPGDVLISVGDHEQLMQLVYLAQARHGEEHLR